MENPRALLRVNNLQQRNRYAHNPGDPAPGKQRIFKPKRGERSRSQIHKEPQAEQRAKAQQQQERKEVRGNGEEGNGGNTKDDEKIDKHSLQTLRSRPI